MEGVEVTIVVFLCGGVNMRLLKEISTHADPGSMGENIFFSFFLLFFFLGMAMSQSIYKLFLFVVFLGLVLLGKISDSLLLAMSSSHSYILRISEKLDFIHFVILTIGSF